MVVKKKKLKVLYRKIGYWKLQRHDYLFKNKKSIHSKIKFEASEAVI